MVTTSRFDLTLVLPENISDCSAGPWGVFYTTDALCNAQQMVTIYNVVWQSVGASEDNIDD